MTKKQKVEFFKRLNCSCFKSWMEDADIVIKLEKEKCDMLIALIECYEDCGEFMGAIERKKIVGIIEKATNKPINDVIEIYKAVSNER